MASPFTKTDLFGSLPGKRIVKVQRWLFIDDYNYYDPQICDQEADGPTEITTDDGFVFSVVGKAEEMGVEVVEGAMIGVGPSFAGQEVTSNNFWSSRIDKPIVAVDLLQSIHEAPKVESAFGVEVFLDQADSFVIEYLSDEEHVDQTRVTGPYAGPPCRRTRIAG